MKTTVEFVWWGGVVVVVVGFAHHNYFRVQPNYSVEVVLRWGCDNNCENVRYILLILV